MIALPVDSSVLKWWLKTIAHMVGLIPAYLHNHMAEWGNLEKSPWIS